MSTQTFCPISAVPRENSHLILRAADATPTFPRVYRGLVRPVEADHTDHIAALTDALRDSARWLQSAGDTLQLQSLKDAAARAQATLAEVAT